MALFTNVARKPKRAAKGQARLVVADWARQSFGLGRGLVLAILAMFVLTTQVDAMVCQGGLAEDYPAIQTVIDQTSHKSDISSDQDTDICIHGHLHSAASDQRMMPTCIAAPSPAGAVAYVMPLVKTPPAGPPSEILRPPMA